MKVKIEKISEIGRNSIIEIFNYYIENSAYAFPEKKIGDEFFEFILKLSKLYPSAMVRDDEKVIGFGIIKPYNQIDSFKSTAEIAYFITPEYIGKGIGEIIHENLIKQALEKGIKNIVATINSENIYSIKFHEKRGYIKCGEIKMAGRKKEKNFNLLLMQKFI